MEAKKNPKADLTRTTGMFLNLGLVVSLLIVISAFEYKFYDDGSLVDLGQVKDEFEDMLEIPPTEQPPPPPPKIQQPEIIEVPDEEEIEEEIEVDLDVEITEETVIEVVIDEAPEEEVADEIFTIVEDQPEFPGGMAAFYQYVQKNMKYPTTARRMGIEGKVYVSFVVDRNGNISQVELTRGIGAGCDEEALRVIKESPKWKAGKQRGQPVRVRMVLPITFKLS